jgi:hypothetical protein
VEKTAENGFDIIAMQLGVKSVLCNSYMALSCCFGFLPRDKAQTGAMVSIHEIVLVRKISLEKSLRMEGLMERRCQKGA